MTLCKLTRMRDSEAVFLNPSNVVAVVPHEGGSRIVTTAAGSDSGAHGINVMESPEKAVALLEEHGA